MRILAAWIGTHDLDAAGGSDEARLGPIAPALADDSYDLALLLANQDEK